MSATAIMRVDRYALFEEIASGGMATVYLGQVVGAAGFTRPVAIKRLHAALAKDPEFVTMFLDEAHLAARIRHPNIVSVLDVVQHEHELFLVMEYVAGESLAGLARRSETPAEIPITLAVIAGVLRGLHAAHETVDPQGRPLGVIHRDVSPQNVLVAVDGTPRLLDFGVAKAAWRVQTTRDGQIKGKLSYMAPEQLQGSVIDRRVDLYATSIVLWEMLTGRRLFAAAPPGDAIVRILASSVEAPSRYNASVPAALDALVLRGLSRNPERRFATAQDMASAVEALMPLASPRQVGEWVERVARETLDERAAALARIEGEDAVHAESAAPLARRARPEREPREDATPATALERAVVPSAGVTHDERASSMDPPPRSRSRLVVAGLIVGLVTAAGALAAARRDGAGRESAAFPSSAPALTVGVPSVAASGMPLASTSSSSPAPASPPSTAPAPAAPAALTAKSGRPTPASRTPHAAAARPSSSVTRSCDPPYYVDPKGIHVPKPECLE